MSHLAIFQVQLNTTYYAPALLCVAEPLSAVCARTAA